MDENGSGVVRQWHLVLVDCGDHKLNWIDCIIDWTLVGDCCPNVLKEFLQGTVRCHSLQMMLILASNLETVQGILRAGDAYHASV